MIERLRRRTPVITLVLVTLGLLVLQAAPASALTANYAAGTLTVTGDASNDVVDVTCVAGSAKVNGDDPDTGAQACSDVTVILINGGEGQDDLGVENYAGQFPNLVSTGIGGGPGIDFLYGTMTDDTISGGPDDDVIQTYGGNDNVSGDGGEDRLWTTNSTSQTLINGSVSATAPNALITFDTVEELWLSGSSVDDQLDASGFTGGNLSIFGLQGTDVIVGSPKADRIDGREGPDTIKGGGGADEITGDDGNDKLSGGNGADTLLGQAGNDRLNGGKGGDACSGGPGTDTLRACES